MTWQLDLCRPDWGEKIGEVSAGEFGGVVGHLSAGDWSLSAPVAALEGLKVSAVDYVGSITVWDGGLRLYDGQVTAPDGVERSMTADGETVVWTGKHCYGLLDQRRMWPDPTSRPPWDVTKYKRRGQASTVAATAIAEQAGVAALPDRQIVGLEVRDNGAGPSDVWSAESSELLSDYVGRVCSQADISCVPAIRRDGPSFVLTGRRDLTSTVVLSAESDLSSWTRKWVPRTVTDVVGFDAGGKVETVGSGAGASRIETIIDVAEADELLRTVQTAYADGAEQWYVGAVLSPVGAARLRYLVDYRVGDFIGVMIGGDRFPLPVTSAVLSWTPDDESVTPVLGAGSRDSLHRLLRLRPDFELLLRRRAI